MRHELGIFKILLFHFIYEQFLSSLPGHICIVKMNGRKSKIVIPVFLL